MKNTVSPRRRMNSDNKKNSIIHRFYDVKLLQQQKYRPAKKNKFMRLRLGNDNLSVHSNGTSLGSTAIHG